MKRVPIAASLTSLLPFLLVALPGAAQNAAPAAQAGAIPSAPAAATTTAPPKGFAQQIVLWPDGAPLAHGTSEGDVPKLFTYPAAASFGAGPHAAVIVMPGGGYTHLVMEQEGAYEARWLAAHGVAAFVLEYRLSPAYVYPTQMLDASRAIRYVRAHAAELGVDPKKVGIWGFSAGGHLAGYMATVHHAANPAAKDATDQQSDRPDFAIISYGGLSLDINSLEGKTPMASILGQHPTQTVIDSIDPVKHVTADTSPCFIYSTTADQTVSSLNSAEFYIALKRAGVPAELHIFEIGQHGTHMGQDARPGQEELKVTPELLINWMALHGWMQPGQQP
ncbi:MAG TPA: alpha/beta hydrolase [Acidobacteriaceae bacterium]|nr:alpha/beta hydrolase [Acidobacteriaceae bacterium]